MSRGIKITRQYEQKISYLAGLTEKIHDAIFSTGLDLTIKSWNFGAQKMYGYSSSEAIGQSAKSLLKITSVKGDLEKSRNELDKKGYYDGEVGGL